MTIAETCYVCHQVLEEHSEILEIGEGNRRIVLHKECLALFAELVRSCLGAEDTQHIVQEGDYSQLPSINKESDSEPDAIKKLLRWARRHHPQHGLTPKDVGEILKDRYRWKISNPSARLGLLLEQGFARREKEGRTYRYYSTTDQE